MKKHLTATLLFAALLISGVTLTAQAQAKPAAPAHYKDLVDDNPTAEADIQVVTNYLNALVARNTDQGKLLLADTYRGYGPAAVDSATRDQKMAQWQKSTQTQSARKMTMQGQTTFRVKSGRLRGNWVATWGDYLFTQNGKVLQVPFQYTAHVTNGKIDLDRTYNDNLSPSLVLGYKLTPAAK